MSVQLILLEDVADLGKIGEQVHVAEGYARNYLLPRKLAAKATPGVLKRIEIRKAELQKAYEEAVAAARELAEKVSKLSITITAKTAENDKLYGSVNAQQITEAIAAQGIELEKGAVLLDEPLHELGTFDVAVKLHADVRTTVKVTVARSEAEA